MEPPGAHGAPGGGDPLTPRSPSAACDSLLVQSVSFGAFPRIDRLNPRFVVGRERLRIVIDVDAAALGPGVTAPSLFERLREYLPSLSRHRCGGGTPLDRTLADAETGLCAAHLLEHVVIDLQHRIAGIRPCSGVTCGYEIPRHRYDIFVETTDRAVGSLSVAIGRGLMIDLLSGSRPDSIHHKTIELARYLFLNPAARLTHVSAARAVGGNGRAAAALAVLREHGYVMEQRHSINFSNVPMYALASRRSGPDS